MSTGSVNSTISTLEKSTLEPCCCASVTKAVLKLATVTDSREVMTVGARVTDTRIVYLIRRPESK